MPSAFPSRPEDILDLDVGELALAILARLQHAAVVNRINFIAEAIGTMAPPSGPVVSPYARTINSEPAAARALAEAWDWLFLHGLVSPDPVARHDNYFVTRRGKQVLTDGVVKEEW
jgi:hypothetical protein